MMPFAMCRPLQYCCLIFFFCHFHFQLFAQPNTTEKNERTAKDSLADPAWVTINDVMIIGNGKTRPMIIFREVPFQKGDSLPVDELPAKLKLARDLLMNTTLFVDVKVYVSTFIREGGRRQALITIDVKERWYLFPLPYFRLIDRNFNQWWVDQKRSLDRVNYGLKFIQNNFTGRNDNLDIWLITGYNQQISFRYQLPFIDKKLTKGINIGLQYSTQKELNFITEDNKQVFVRKESVIRENFRIEATYSYRPDVRQRHYFRTSYNREHIHDTILLLNPKYFPSSRTSAQFVDFNYQYKYYNVDYIPYPTRGWMLEANLYSRLIQKNLDLWQASARAVYTIPLLAEKRFLHLEAVGILKAPVNDAFFNQRLLGYHYAQMRGLEYNVMDGSAAGILKTTFHQHLFSVILKNPANWKAHERIPIRFFLKAFADVGYAYNRYSHPSNTLNNTLLRSWGIGIDVVSVYDFVFKIQFSMNQLGTDGVYLHSRNDF
jgi:outer membrane protein assembly factor BamA